MSTAPGSAAGASGCTRAAARTALASFVAAFNSGDYGRLDALFASRPLFRWYSSGPPGQRVRAASKNRDTLVSYFRARHLKQDRLRLRAFRFTGNSPGYDNSPGYGNFVFALRRSAADYRRGAWFDVVGKGAAVCSEPPSQAVQLIVVSIGGPRSRGR